MLWAWGHWFCCYCDWAPALWGIKVLPCVDFVAHYYSFNQRLTHNIYSSHTFWKQQKHTPNLQNHALIISLFTKHNTQYCIKCNELFTYKLIVTILHLIFLSSFKACFLMESIWINHVRSPKLINVWHNEFNIISEMCSFILSWFSP